MAGLFSGLEKFGLGKLSEMKVYEEEKAKTDEKSSATQKQAPQITEADLLFDKTYQCPCCDTSFKSKAVRAGKVKLVSQDTDLRPRYQQLDCTKYDAVACPKCGYAALSRFFPTLTSAQAKLIKENVSKNFNGFRDDGGIYSYDDAINRYKLALISAIVKHSKLSERAYVCLKLAWVLRGKAENVPKVTAGYDAVIENLHKEEEEALTNAYEGFSGAFSKENFPMCGMDESTVELLMAELARRIGKTSESSRWISQILSSRDCNDRIKEKARNIKELLETEA